MKRPPHPALLYGALVLHTFLSAGTYLVGKRALAEIPPLTLGLLRFAIASVCLVGLLYARLPRGQRLPPPDERRRLWGLAFIAVPLNQGFFLVGLSLSTAAHAALLYSLTPLFVLLLAWLALGESLGARGAIGLLLALGGTVFVLLQSGLDLSGGPLLGDLLLVFAVLAWAAYTTGGRKVVARHGPLPTTAWSLVGGTLLFLPVGLGTLALPSTRDQLAHASGAAWGGIAYLSILTSVVAYLLWYWALAHLPAARVAVFSNLQPLATAVLAQFTLGEQITPQFIGGALVVMAGVVLAQTGPAKVQPAGAPPDP